MFSENNTCRLYELLFADTASRGVGPKLRFSLNLYQVSVTSFLTGIQKGGCSPAAVNPNSTIIGTHAACSHAFSFSSPSRGRNTVPSQRSSGIRSHQTDLNFSNSELLVTPQCATLSKFSLGKAQRDDQDITISPSRTASHFSANGLTCPPLDFFN